MSINETVENSSRIVSTGEDGLKMLGFIDLTKYGHFFDPVEREKFLASDIGKEQAALMRAEVKGIMGVDGELTDDQIGNMLHIAQSMQASGAMQPNLEINTDPKTAGVMPFKPIEGSQKPEATPDASEPEQMAEAYADSIVMRINQELAGSVDVYDPEIEEAIQGMADKMAEAIYLSGIDLDPEDVAEAVAQGMNGYGNVEAKYFAEMFNKIDVDHVAEYFVNSSPEGALMALREGPDVYINDLGYGREVVADAKLEDIGPSIHEIGERFLESGILDDIERNDADTEFSEESQELMQVMKDAFNEVSKHDPDSDAAFESSARDMSVEDNSVGITVEPNDPGLENENSDTAILYKM